MQPTRRRRRRRRSCRHRHRCPRSTHRSGRCGGRRPRSLATSTSSSSAPPPNRCSAPSTTARAWRCRSTATTPDPPTPTSSCSRRAPRSSSSPPSRSRCSARRSRSRPASSGASPVGGVVTGDVYVVGGGDPVLSGDWYATSNLERYPVFNTTSFDALADGARRRRCHTHRRTCARRRHTLRRRVLRARLGSWRRRVGGRAVRRADGERLARAGRRAAVRRPERGRGARVRAPARRARRRRVRWDGCRPGAGRRHRTGVDPVAPAHRRRPRDAHQQRQQHGRAAGQGDRARRPTAPGRATPAWR